MHRADWLYWDPAAHALYGVRIAEAVRHLRILELLKTLNEQTLWPPLHSLLQLPFQFLFGPGFYASALCSFVFLALVFPALTYLYQRCSESWAGWAVLMAFAASSPYYAGFGSMPMLEIFGAALAAMSAALYLKSSRWFPLSLALLFFLKYNYCLYVLMPVLAWESLQFRSARRTLPRMTPFGWFIAVYLLLMGIILVTGGFKIGKLSMRGIGNPLYALFLIVLIRAAIKGQYREAWRGIRGTGWEWFAVPVLVWLIIPVPNRVKTLVSFAINASLGGGHTSKLSYYTFYFNALYVYFSTWWLETLCAIGAITIAVMFRRRKEVAFLALMFALPFALMTLNQNKQERFLFTFVPALWALCALAVSRLPHAAVRAAAAIAVCACCFWFYDVKTVEVQVAWPFVPLTVEAPVGYVAAAAADAREVRVLGTLNEMSPALIAYHIMRAAAGRSVPHLEWEVEKNPPPGTRIIAINGEPPGAALESKTFPGGYRVTISVVP